MTNYFRRDNKVYLVLCRYNQRGIAMIHGITLDGHYTASMPVLDATFV